MYKEISYYNNDGEKVWNRTISFKGRFNDDKGYSLYAHGNTISGRKSVNFPKEMNKNQIANMLLLSKHLLPISNVIGYRTNKGTAPMTIHQIGEVIGTQERQTRRFITKMMELQLMRRVGDGYVINPLYFMNGKTISHELYWLFNESLNEHLPKWVKDKYAQRHE